MSKMATGCTSLFPYKEGEFQIDFFGVKWESIYNVNTRISGDTVKNILDSDKNI